MISDIMRHLSVCNIYFLFISCFSHLLGLALLSQYPIFKKQIGLSLPKNQSFSDTCWYVVLLVVMMNGIP